MRRPAEAHRQPCAMPLPAPVTIALGLEPHRGMLASAAMRFGINFFPSFRPEDSSTADYYAQCLRIAERADQLGYSSIKTVEHSFTTMAATRPIPACSLRDRRRTRRVAPHHRRR
jgi:hypothetical protein